MIDDPVRSRAGTVDLVDDDDRLQALGQRLARDEARLRHRPLDGIDQQQHAVDHRQHALDLAAEVRMAGRVDDVDVRALVVDRTVLREDRDAALALEVVRVHDALGHVLVLAERSGLREQLVDQGGLAVIDVRDDRDVAQLAFHDQCSFVRYQSFRRDDAPFVDVRRAQQFRVLRVHPHARTVRLRIDRQPLSLPEASGQGFIQFDPRQRVEQRVHRPQARTSLAGDIVSSVCQRHRVVQRQRPDPRPAQRDQMRPAPQRTADVLGQHPHIGALAALDVERHVRRPTRSTRRRLWITTCRGARSTSIPARASSYSGRPSRFSAECIGGTCSIVPRSVTARRRSTHPSHRPRPSAVTSPSASPVVVVTPSFSVAR